MIDDNDKFEELLCDWELARQEGRELSVENLCSQHPHLLDRLRKGIGQLKATSWMLNDEAQRAFSEEEHRLESKRRGGETLLPDSDVTILEFVQFASDSGILSESDVSKLNQQAEVHQQSPVGTFAKKLIEDNILTEYQARTILEKGNSPLLLDRYIVLDTIGSGGMGLVFKAVHRSMERVVALKVLPRFAVNSPDKVNRFQREIKATASLSHPNVVAAYDAHESNGTFFLVLEYVDGVNLAEHVEKNGPLPVAEAVSLIVQIADGLEEAHRNGIIHRDIKPTNIMLTNQGVAKLLDLGLARTRELVQETTSNELTRDGLAMGTVDYMSPEQALDSKEVDARSDLYSLGCTLYFLLTGKPPFERSTTVKTIVAHRENAPPSLLAVRDDIPNSLEQVFFKMVAKNPADRHNSVAEFRSHLLACGLVDESSGQVEPVALRPNVNSVDAKQPKSAALPSSRKKTSVEWKRWVLVATVVFVVSAIGWLSFPWLVGDSTATNVSQRDIAKWALSGSGEVSIQSELGNQTLNYLEELPDSDFQITGLGIHGNEETLSLKAIGKLEQLGSLEIFGYYDFDLRQLEDLTALTDLSVGGETIGDQDLVGVERLSHLTSLDVSVSNLTDVSLKRIASMDWLEELYLSENDFSHNGFRLLSSMPRLKTVAVDSTEFDGNDLEYLPKNLTRLYASGCNLSDEDVSKIDKLARLKVLDIRETGITGSGMAKLKLRNLEELYVDGSVVSENALLELGKLPKLQLLSLDGLDVTQTCVDALLKMPDLQTLSLDGSSLDDTQLMQLAKATNLTTIHLVETNVTEEGLLRFAEAMPACDVYTDIENEFE